MSSLKLKHLLFLLVLLAACVLCLSHSETGDEARAPKRRPPLPRRPPPPARRPPPPPPPPPRHPPPPPPSPPPPHSFMLALTWPYAYCNEPVPCISVVGLKQHFTIHGLWPKDKFGSSMRNCDVEQLTDKTINGFKEVLRKDLMEYWPKLGNEKSFYAAAGSWKVQWRDHGSCSTFLPEVYFEKATALARVHGTKVLQSLATDSIKPDGTTQHNSTTVLAAIKKGTGKNAVLSCNQDKNGKLQLLEVRLCFNAKAETLVDCKGGSPSCDKDFIFASKPTLPPPPPRYPSTHNTRSLGLTSFMLDVEEAAEF